MLRKEKKKITFLKQNKIFFISIHFDFEIVLKKKF